MIVGDVNLFSFRQTQRPDNGCTFANLGTVADGISDRLTNPCFFHIWKFEIGSSGLVLMVTNLPPGFSDLAIDLHIRDS